MKRKHFLNVKIEKKPTCFLFSFINKKNEEIDEKYVEIICRVTTERAS
jgi:hypothetical protein